MSHLRHYPKDICLTAFFELLAILFNLSAFVFIVPFVELLFGGGAAGAAEPQFAFNQKAMSDWLSWKLAVWDAQYGKASCLAAVAVAYLACVLLSNLFRFLSGWFVSPIRNGVVERLRNDFFKQLTILPIGWYKNRHTGDLLSRMSNDMADIEWSAVCSIQTLVKSPINIVVLAASLLFISPTLFLYFILVVPVVVLIVGFVGKHLKHGSVKSQKKLGDLFSVIEENLTNIRVIKAFGGEARQRDVFGRVSADWRRKANRVVRLKELGSHISELLGVVAMSAIIIIGGRYVMAGHMHPSVFILFVVIFARIIPPVQSLVRAWNYVQKGDASAARVFEILDAAEVVVEKPQARTLGGFSNQIEYRGVSFSYPDDPKTLVLEDVGLVVPRGSTVAVVGHSGSGKTTLADLLPRFYDPTSGCITIDGEDIRDLRIESLRSQIALVTQEPVLFNDTVLANIALGDEHPDIERVHQSARLAYAEQFIMSLPDGYDTLLGDRGLTLSGGQRQRVAIARALYKDCPILILDEATASLDSESERQVQAALDSLMHGRTSIVIAHRLQTIRNANYIYVFDKGRIVESGIHDELVNAGGTYSKLVAAQFID